MHCVYFISKLIRSRALQFHTVIPSPRYRKIRKNRRKAGLDFMSRFLPMTYLLNLKNRQLLSKRTDMTATLSTDRSLQKRFVSLHKMSSEICGPKIKWKTLKTFMTLYTNWIVEKTTWKMTEQKIPMRLQGLGILILEFTNPRARVMLSIEWLQVRRAKKMWDLYCLQHELCFTVILFVLNVAHFSWNFIKVCIFLAICFILHSCIVHFDTFNF